MNETLLAFRAAGCDVDGALARLLQNEDLFLSFLPRALNDRAFADLGSALESQDQKTAFEAAHSLKGTWGNLGLTPIYKRVTTMVEVLRNGSLEGMSEEYLLLAEERAKLLALL